MINTFALIICLHIFEKIYLILHVVVEIPVKYLIFETKKFKPFENIAVSNVNKKFIQKVIPLVG